MIPRLGQGFTAVSLKDPTLFAGSLELKECEPEFLGIPEGSQPKRILFQGPHEPFSTVITPGFTDKSRRRFDLKQGEFLLKKVGDEPGAMIVTERKPFGYIFSERTKAVSNSLPDGLKGFKPRSTPACMGPDAFHRTVIHGEEDRDPAFFRRETRGPVASPHLIDPLGCDGAIVGFSPRGMPNTTNSRQVVLSHEPRDPSHGSSQTAKPQPCPHTFRYPSP